MVHVDFSQAALSMLKSSILKRVLSLGGWAKAWLFAWWVRCLTLTLVVQCIDLFKTENNGNHVLVTGLTAEPLIVRATDVFGFEHRPGPLQAQEGQGRQGQDPGNFPSSESHGGWCRKMDLLRSK